MQNKNSMIPTDVTLVNRERISLGDGKFVTGSDRAKDDEDAFVKNIAGNIVSSNSDYKGVVEVFNRVASTVDSKYNLAESVDLFFSVDAIKQIIPDLVKQREAALAPMLKKAARDPHTDWYQVSLDVAREMLNCVHGTMQISGNGGTILTQIRVHVFQGLMCDVLFRHIHAFEAAVVETFGDIRDRLPENDNVDPPKTKRAKKSKPSKPSKPSELVENTLCIPQHVQPSPNPVFNTTQAVSSPHNNSVDPLIYDGPRGLMFSTTNGQFMARCANGDMQLLSRCDTAESATGPTPEDAAIYTRLTSGVFGLIATKVRHADIEKFTTTLAGIVRTVVSRVEVFDYVAIWSEAVSPGGGNRGRDLKGPPIRYDVVVVFPQLTNLPRLAADFLATFVTAMISKTEDTLVVVHQLEHYSTSTDKKRRAGYWPLLFADKKQKWLICAAARFVGYEISGSIIDMQPHDAMLRAMTGEFARLPLLFSAPGNSASLRALLLMAKQWPGDISKMHELLEHMDAGVTAVFVNKNVTRIVHTTIAEPSIDVTHAKALSMIGVIITIVRDEKKTSVSLQTINQKDKVAVSQTFSPSDIMEMAALKNLIDALVSVK